MYFWYISSILTFIFVIFINVFIGKLINIIFVNYFLKNKKKIKTSQCLSALEISNIQWYSFVETIKCKGNTHGNYKFEKFLFVYPFIAD
jgi:uncharacterized membrane protein YgaE (UPF0421/DUF939 family)